MITFVTNTLLLSVYFGTLYIYATKLPLSAIVSSDLVLLFLELPGLCHSSYN